jgi:hypothetical protein
MSAVKPPKPDPLLVVKSLISGGELVLQQRPLAVTGLPPSEEIYPPELADVVVILLRAYVLKVGSADCNTTPSKFSYSMQAAIKNAAGHSVFVLQNFSSLIF